MTFLGSCHCGAVEIRYETAIPAEDWAPRACQCTFCRKHGARNVSDSHGQWQVRGRVTRYRFALRTADFLATLAKASEGSPPTGSTRSRLCTTSR